jgi:hypothetical protein
MKEELIAPCGMNCSLCSGYLAFTHQVKSKGVRTSYCTGCRPRGKTCAFLKKKCERLLSGSVRYCYECPQFPCVRLLNLDKRYRTLFRMSMVENARFIKEKGMIEFLAREEQKWRCPQCGDVICCHNGICYNCGLAKLKAKKLKYRWDEG